MKTQHLHKVGADDPKRVATYRLPVTVEGLMRDALKAGMYPSFSRLIVDAVVRLLKPSEDFIQLVAHRVAKCGAETYEDRRRILLQMCARYPFSGEQLSVPAEDGDEKLLNPAEAARLAADFDEQLRRDLTTNPAHVSDRENPSW